MTNREITGEDVMTLAQAVEQGHWQDEDEAAHFWIMRRRGDTSFEDNFEYATINGEPPPLVQSYSDESVLRPNTPITANTSALQQKRKQVISHIGRNQHLWRTLTIKFGGEGGFRLRP